MPSSRSAVMDELNIDRSAVGACLSRLWVAALRISSPLWTIVRRRPLDSIAATVCTAAAGAILLNALFLQNAPHPAPMLAGTVRPIALPEATGSVVVALPRPRPNIGDIAKPTEIAKPVGEVAKPEPAPVRARPQSIADLTKPTAEAAKPEAAPARVRSQVIADIQRELSRRGFFDGATDGLYGPKTDAAIRDFEHAAKLKASAQPDEALLRDSMRTPIQSVAATPAEPPPPRPPAAIRTASVKPAVPAGRVLAVQRALAEYGYGQVTPNGVVGAETKAAIERFERERKLPVTGQVSDRLARELAAVTGRPLE